MFKILLLICNILKINPGERSKRSVVATTAVSAAIVATINAVANDIGSQQWQWWGQAMVAETEAAAGAHTTQPTDGSDSNRNSIRGGDSGNGGSRGSGSGDSGNGAATAAAQTVGQKKAEFNIRLISDVLP